MRIALSVSVVLVGRVDETWETLTVLRVRAGATRGVSRELRSGILRRWARRWAQDRLPAPDTIFREFPPMPRSPRHPALSLLALLASLAGGSGVLAR